MALAWPANWNSLSAVLHHHFSQLRFQLYCEVRLACQWLGQYDTSWSAIRPAFHDHSSRSSCFGEGLRGPRGYAQPAIASLEDHEAYSNPARPSRSLISWCPWAHRSPDYAVFRLTFSGKLWISRCIGAAAHSWSSLDHHARKDDSTDRVRSPVVVAPIAAPLEANCTSEWFLLLVRTSSSCSCNHSCWYCSSLSILSEYCFVMLVFSSSSLLLRCGAFCWHSSLI